MLKELQAVSRGEDLDSWKRVTRASNNGIICIVYMVTIKRISKLMLKSTFAVIKQWWVWMTYNKKHLYLSLF